MTKHKTGHKIELGAAIAGAAGFVAGVVAANKPGTQAQKNDTFESIEERLKFLYMELNDLITNTSLETKAAMIDKKAKKQLDTALEVATASKDKIAKILESINDGDIEDKDLKLALKDAESAIVHAKKFLLKK